ncbi:hypothetical protein CONPUDRAFT_91955 [Coniophora puteana RWD-64-598 SS2]|uniref:Uncharacterized protein n=1 Tax=Coniophora puteana (strain RWD-64-598) TaxID=741705 RepID=A0A5M3MIJ4_CONPW|nr:uncharacterized protein CONPUDRAFT_91955 [Coniophora puteana RWD-64-598 SS2]EIW78604.1 hypothetical protein CONPUDRAFT_91955 [Coniophora puteana RWD-64-598 SS2]
MAHTMFDKLRDEQLALGLDPWAPFDDGCEWALARWLVTNVGKTAIEEFLKLPIVRQRLGTSYHSAYTLFKKVDALPHSADWHLKNIEVSGNVAGKDGKPMKENLELWFRNPVDCIRDLFGNPQFAESMVYAPEQVFDDDNGKMQQYEEMWTGDWWWETQGRLPEGAVVAPVILASDKTALSMFSGNKTAWPVYLTVGNILKAICRQPSKCATILIGYIPVTKLECFSEDIRSEEGYRLFHYCMDSILDALKDAGANGVPMTCPDCAEPLAYIHWYQPLNTIDASLSMYKIVRSSRLHGPHMSVVRISEILCSCHLIPYGGGDGVSSWTRESALDNAETFLLNHYIDLDFFEHVRVERSRARG